MATKELVGGALVIAGSGGGVVAYYVYSTNSIGEYLQKSKQLQLLSVTSEDGTTSGKDHYHWKVIAVNYSTDDNDKFSDVTVNSGVGAEGKTTELTKAITDLQNKCKEILDITFTNEDSEDYKKAFKWCVKPTLIQDEIAKDNREPILEAESDYWDKAYDRYFMEIENDSDKLNEAGGKEDRKSGEKDSSKKDKFKKACLELLRKEYVASTSGDDKSKAEKWCVKFKSVGEELSKKVSEETNKDNDWKSKYDTATSASASDTDLKTVLEKFKEKKTTEKEAMKTWCTIAINASAEKFKDKVNTNCILVAKS